MKVLPAVVLLASSSNAEEIDRLRQLDIETSHDESSRSGKGLIMNKHSNGGIWRLIGPSFMSHLKEVHVHPRVRR